MSDNPTSGEQESAIPGWNTDGTKRNPTTTGEHYPYGMPDESEQPKPTTGEWTVDTVRGLLYEDLSEETGMSNVVDAHNAAIAEQWDAYVKLARERTKLREQLAAERDKHEAMIKQIVEQTRIGVDNLQQQLAAFREGKARCEKQLDATMKQLAAEREVGHNQAVTLGQHIARLEDQLAAAVEAAYKEGRDDGYDSVAATDEYNEKRWQQSEAKAALAKIGGK